MKKLIAVCVAMALLSGCATRGAGYVPMVDTKHTDTSQLSVDIAECQAYAGRSAGPATGAIAGAIIGGLLMAFLMPKGFKNWGAGQGAMMGAVGGAVQSTEAQEVIINRCLAGRGHSVLQ